MKKFLVAAMLLVGSVSAHAGAVKELVIDAEDSVAHYFYVRGLAVLDVENMHFVPTGVADTVALESDVTVQDKIGSAVQKFVCVTTFAKDGYSYDVKQTLCK